MARRYTRFRPRGQQQFSESGGGVSRQRGVALRTHPLRRAHRACVRQARRPVRRAGDLLDGHDGLVVSRPGAARRQGGLVPSGRGASGQLLRARADRAAHGRHRRLLPRPREALRSGVARTQLRGGRRDGSGRRSGLAVEGQTCQADRRLHVYDARHGGEPGRVSPAEIAEARRGAADRPCRWRSSRWRPPA